jgi:glycosyltransferase involved in cell wall biosynthesis
MDISLIICTRNRGQQLACCLDFVKNIEFGRSWELIVVDNGSTDCTAEVVHSFIKTIEIRGRYIVEPHQGKSNALNTGLTAANGEIIVFVDDDCYPSIDFLSQIWSRFRDPSVGYITGRVMLHDSRDYPATINESITPLTYPGRSFVWPGAVQGGNVAFRRQVLVEIGGFDPLFGPGSLFKSAEDVEVASRVSAIGWKGEYRPEMIVRHHHGRKKSDMPRLMRDYGIGIGAYHMKLLLSGREYSWFAASIYQFPRRYSASRRLVAWEPVGAAKYAWWFFRKTLSGRVKIKRKTGGEGMRDAGHHPSVGK